MPETFMGWEFGLIKEAIALFPPGSSFLGSEFLSALELPGVFFAAQASEALYGVLCIHG
jgi:hypothetical protein